MCMKKGVKPLFFSFILIPRNSQTTKTSKVFFDVVWVLNMEKKHLKCKVCKKRSWFKPEIRIKKINGRFVQIFYIKCPKCFSEGTFRYKEQYEEMFPKSIKTITHINPTINIKSCSRIKMGV